jgi:sugar lactone lactonase YvrE
MLELAIAGAIFLLVAGVLSLAVASDIGTRDEALVRGQLTADLVQAESVLANGSYDSLLANTFTPPNACSGTGTGTTGQSCYTIAGDTYEANWAIGTGTDASTALTLTGTSTLPSGAVITESRVVNAPSYDYSATEGTVRVTISNSPSGWNGVGPIYLLEQNDPSDIVASGPVTNGVAILSGEPALCSLANPCVVGLAGGDEFATNGSVSELPSEVWGPGSGVTLTAGGLTDATLDLTGVGTADLDLVATNTNTGQSEANAVAGSVCLYLNFNDGVAQQSVPVCNFASAGSLDVATYAPDPANPDTRMPLPIGVPMTFSTDSAGGGCPFVENPTPPGPVGSQGLTGSGWAGEAVCTSWTWGNPATATLNGVTTGWNSTTLTLSAGTIVSGSINWKGPGLGASAFVADSGNNLVRMITPGGSVTAWAGTGAAGLVNGPASSAEFNNPTAVAVASDGTVYVTDTGNNVIRAITPGGVVSTLATGFSNPHGLVLDSTGTDLYVADTGHNQIDEVSTSTGAVTVLSGDGASGHANGSGSSAEFAGPKGVALYGGVLYVADTGNNAIRAVATSGGATTDFAGTGASGSTNGPAGGSSFNSPQGVTVDNEGDVFVADTGNNEIREVSVAGSVSTFSGQTAPGFVNGSAGSAKFSGPEQLAEGLGGVLYVADTGNNVVRAVSTGGTASTLAGTGVSGSSNGDVATATFSGDSGVGSGPGWVSGQPAIGFGSVPVWSGARLVQSCSSSGTCTSIGTTVPENTACPGQACYSGSAPVSGWITPQIGARRRQVVVL